MSKAPTVALESTVISHGLPYPHNLRLALRLEEIVREGGALPATVGIIAGEIIVWLSAAQIKHLATAAERVQGQPLRRRFDAASLAPYNALVGPSRI